MTTSPPAFDALIAATDAASGVLDGHRRSRSDNIQTALIQANSSGHHHPTTWNDNEGDSVRNSMVHGVYRKHYRSSLRCSILPSIVR